MNKCSMSQILVLLLLWSHYGAVTSQVRQRVSPTIAAGTNGTLNCNVSDIVGALWYFRGRGAAWERIAHGREVYQPEQYEIEVSNNDTEMVLIVKNAEEDDEGIYSCQDQGMTTTQFNVTVEIPPLLHLKTRDVIINATMDVIFKEETSVQCVATGSKPSVSLSWEVNDQEETGTITVNNSREDDRVIVSTLQYIPNREDETLACVTGGQQVVPSKKIATKVNVMSKPNCNLLVTNETTNEFRLVCYCDANPSPSDYSIYVNGILHSTNMETFISSQQAAKVFCNAYNIIGNDTTNVQELTPFQAPQPLLNSHVALIVCVCVAVPAFIVIVVVFFVSRWKSARLQQKMRATNDASLLDTYEALQHFQLTPKVPPPPRDDNEQSTPRNEGQDFSNRNDVEEMNLEELQKLNPNVDYRDDEHL